MATKLQLLLTALASVAFFGHSALAARRRHLHRSHGEDHAPPSSAPYSFEYGVKSSDTQDIKGQYEESDGHGNVKGSYSLVEADGSTRVVEYTADDERGFVAVVKKTGGDAAAAGGYYGERDARAAAAAGHHDLKPSAHVPSFGPSAHQTVKPYPSIKPSAHPSVKPYLRPSMLLSLQPSKPSSSYYKFYWSPNDL